VNFALFSENATRVELCLFDSPEATRESVRVDLPEQTDMVWHGWVSGLQPGQLYGYRVHGPYDPGAGHRFNPAKVVLDPYAKAIGRPTRWCDENFGYTIGDPSADLSIDGRDNAASAPLAAVVETAFTWGDDRPPRTPWHRTVIYEAHVRGLTQRHPLVPEPLRGTYAALTCDPVLDHLTTLGVTAVELMPVHHHVNDRHLVENGRTNYWGYNTLSYFAPDVRYSAASDPGGTLREFKTMVRALHARGIEVILDVVYNHTGEGNQLGPTLSLRGVDNASYYRLADSDRRYYVDFTGCGNTLNMMHPRVLQLMMDSLRYWVLEMHVDGFRFDLASALARELYAVDRLGAFFDVIHQDPVISQVKLIAEPWDLGEGGYQVGNFPVLWTEWNGRFRDATRRFWRGDGGAVSELATRLAGSADLYAHNGRRPYSSINFVTAHDGFSLQDLVSYERKHNEANGHDNTDGEDHNLSANYGVEGPTDDVEVLALRERQKRNLLATLLLAQGVPMLRAGDELGHTQGGNNNAYCQDNETSWLDWDLDDARRAFLEFTRRLVRLRTTHHALRRHRFMHGEALPDVGEKDITWITPGGREMNERDWNVGFARSLGVQLVFRDSFERHPEAPLEPETLVLLFNAAPEPLSFRLPPLATDQRWELLLDTHDDETTAPKPFRGSHRYRLRDRTVAVLRVLDVPTRGER